MFLHRLPYCDHLRLTSCSARWYASSSTLNDRCPAACMNGSAEEDVPYASPARKPSASKSSLGRRHSIEVCPTRTLDHPYNCCRAVSRGDPQEVMNLGLAGVGFATRDRSSSFVFNENSLSHDCRIRSLRDFIRVRDLILEIHLGPSMFAFPLDMT